MYIGWMNRNRNEILVNALPRAHSHTRRKEDPLYFCTTKDTLHCYWHAFLSLHCDLEQKMGDQTLPLFSLSIQWKTTKRCHWYEIIELEHIYIEFGKLKSSGDTLVLMSNWWQLLTNFTCVNLKAADARIDTPNKMNEEAILIVELCLVNSQFIGQMMRENPLWEDRLRSHESVVMEQIYFDDLKFIPAKMGSLFPSISPSISYLNAHSFSSGCRIIVCSCYEPAS